MYSEAIEKIIFWLEKAATLAETKQQKISLEKLIEFYKTGNLKTFDEYSIQWVKDTESLTDCVNGFIEVYGDPLGKKATFESVVSVRDDEATQRALLISRNAQWFEDHAAYAEIDAKDSQVPTILVVEDSNFFRNQVKGYMTEAGFKVLEGEDGQVALRVLEENIEEITMVVTDIEMPNMNGFQLTEKIKNDKRFRHLPVIALTTLAGDDDVAQGKAVGVDEYHIKLDKERLMECVHRYAKLAMAA